MSLFKKNEKEFAEHYKLVRKVEGQNIKKYRTEKNLSKKEVAEKCGISIKTLTSLEEGVVMDFEVILLFRLSQVLETRVSQFYILPDGGSI